MSVPISLQYPDYTANINSVLHEGYAKVKGVLPNCASSRAGSRAVSRGAALPRWVLSSRGLQRATSMSSLENRNQRRASTTAESGSFIDDLSFSKRCMKNSAHHVASTRNFIRRGYHNVLTNRHITQEPSYLDRSSTLVRCLAHHDQQIHVAPLIGRAPRLRAEQHDARRVESSDDTIHHGRNGRFSCHRPVLMMNDPCQG